MQLVRAGRSAYDTMRCYMVILGVYGISSIVLNREYWALQLNVVRECYEGVPFGGRCAYRALCPPGVAVMEVLRLLS